MRSESSTAARILAPLAFLLAVTVLVLLVRSALDSDPAAVTGTGPVGTQPVGTEPAPAEPEPEEPEPPAEPQPPAQTEPPASAAYYTIESGDTLESIASSHDTTVEQLLELNPGIDPVALTVGQRIRIA